MLSEKEKARRALQSERDRAYRVREVAALWGCSERHVWRMISSGALRSERLGARCVRVFASELDRYRESLRDQAAA